LKSFADDRADGEDGCGGIDAVETDDAACTGNSEANALVGTAGELFEKGPCFGLERARVERAGAEFVKFEAEPIFFVERVLLDEMEFLHGGEETIDGGFVDSEVERYLRDGHFGAILAKVQQNAHSLPQRFAGTGSAVIGRERLSTTLRSGGQRGASEKSQGRMENSLLTRKKGERESRYSYCEPLFHNMKHQRPEEYNRVFARLLACGHPRPGNKVRGLRANTRPAILTNRNNYRFAVSKARPRK
jgi:hypothetical protein